METIISIGIALAIVYTAYKASEINNRLKILDLRQRIMEVLVRLPNEADLPHLYKHHFEELYTGDYDKLVKFGRKHGLNLPLFLDGEEPQKQAPTSEKSN